MSVINPNTPLEEYELQGKKIFVKREDLSTNSPAPSLAKLRGIYKVIEKAKAEGFTKIGVYDTRISKSGWGCQAICQEIGGISVVNFYPHLKEYDEKCIIPEHQMKVIELGGEIYGMKGGRTAVLYTQAKRIMAEKGYFVMPLGLVVEESVRATIEQAHNISQDALGGDLVVCVGSGMITAGIIISLSMYFKNIYAISPGMANNRQVRRIKQFVGEIPSNVHLIMSDMDYYSPCEIEIPFPCNKYYDAKAWKWLTQNISELSDKVLFWNIGA